MKCASLMFLIHFRSSQRRCVVRKGVLRHFTKFAGKHLCQSLFFNQVAGEVKKRLWHRRFPMNFAKFLRTPFLQNTSGCVLLSFIPFIILNCFKFIFSFFLLTHILSNNSITTYIIPA